jgi:hypothetical protein
MNQCKHEATKIQNLNLEYNWPQMHTNLQTKKNEKNNFETLK